MTAIGILLVATVAAPAGCSSGGARPGPVPATGTTAAVTSAASTPSSQPTSTGDPITDGYVYFWQAFLNAQADRNPRSPALAQHATGAGLAWAQQTIAAYIANGWGRLIKRGYQINSRVEIRGTTTAQVVDIEDWRYLPLVTASGAVVRGSNPARQCITAQMQRHQATWVVSTITFAPGRC